MKVLEKIALVLFSYITLILSVILCVLVFGWLNINFVSELLKYAVNDAGISTGILIFSAVVIILDLVCIFGDSEKDNETMKKDGILLENNEGKLLITKETLESLISSVAKGFNGAENVNSKVIVDRDNNLSVYITLFVHPDAVIKDLSSNLQTKIKEAIKNTSDLEVKEVNIKVKNITPEKNIVVD